MPLLQNDIKKSFLAGKKLLDEFITDDDNFKKITIICEKIVESLNSGGKVIISGNGGSLTDSMHFAEEFTGRFRSNRRALPAISLSDPSHITCVANDFGFDYIFSKGIEAYGNKNDIYIGLSTSGNSKNIINAFNKAKELGLTTISLLGKDGGEIKSTTDIEFIINGKTSDRIQEIHMFILHTIVEGVERILFPENY